ncbi:MAG: hypothetical protein RMJ44_11655 [Cytophagales bacterium]|nr:hypothetical protein [Bernardetiaceae bacterium]MDW8211731.1 hypothetical protein [Cytophagales bacterium]
MQLVSSTLLRQKAKSLLLTTIFLLTAFENVAQKSERIKDDLALKNLACDVMLAICFLWLPIADIPANQVYVQTRNTGLLSGLPWNEKQARMLARKLRKAGGKPIKYLIINEFIKDRLPVVAYYARKKVQLIADSATAIQLASYGIRVNLSIYRDTCLVIGKRAIQLYPTGAGFSLGSLAMFLPDCGILHAGYFIPSPTARYPVMQPQTCLNQWITNLEKLYFRFSKVKKVIPGQGMPWYRSLIRRSIVFLDKVNRINQFQEDIHANAD